MKDSIKAMRKVIGELYDKAIYKSNYTQFDAIDDLNEYMISLTNLDEVTTILECCELRNIIELAIMVGCFGKINDRTK